MRYYQSQRDELAKIVNGNTADWMVGFFRIYQRREGITCVDTIKIDGTVG